MLLKAPSHVCVKYDVEPHPHAEIYNKKGSIKIDLAPPPAPRGADDDDEDRPITRAEGEAALAILSLGTCNSAERER
jgi:hypothetical protein